VAKTKARGNNSPMSCVTDIGARAGRCGLRKARKEPRMARAGSRILDSGEVLPAITMDTVAHGRISTPECFGSGWGVFLIYRAHW